jgi:asparagine synthase (glutamine-hydrolysing)
MLHRPALEKPRFDLVIEPSVVDIAEMNAGWRDGIAVGRTPLQVAQAVDCADWLPNDLLIKLDRCLMAHGAEGRTPLLDTDVAALALRLPDALKIHRGLRKWLLRRWVAEKVPQAQPLARKRGFTVPVAQWIARRAAAIGPLFARSPAVRELCRPDAVETLFAAAAQRRAGRAAWTLLFYALWHRRHIERAWPRWWKSIEDTPDPPISLPSGRALLRHGA